MMLKKQTVWLLTMLSLIIVLSVYYITSPQQTPTDMAYFEEQEETAQEEPANTNQSSSETESDDASPTNDSGASDAQVSSISSDELFTQLRLDIQDARSQRIEDWEAIVTSSDATAEMKSDAKEKMDDLRTLAQKESILETLLRKQYNYSDVLVNTMDNKVRIIVKADNLSAKQANEIVQEAHDQLGEGKTVAVEYQK